MNTTRWLDEGEQRAWRSYLQMHGQLLARLNRQLQADSDLSLADYEVLVRLTETPDGRLRPFELQRGLQWEQSRLSHHVTRMRHRGLLNREECTDDGRGAFIVLTDAGRRAIEAAAPGHVDAVRRLFFNRLTRDQITMLGQLSTQVLDRLDASTEVPTGGESTTCRNSFAAYQRPTLSQQDVSNTCQRPEQRRDSSKP